MVIKTKRQARRARMVAQQIEQAKMYARIDAASLWWGWIDVNDHDAFFSSNGDGKMHDNPRVSAAYLKEFGRATEDLARLTEYVDSTNFSS